MAKRTKKMDTDTEFVGTNQDGQEWEGSMSTHSDDAAPEVTAKDKENFFRSSIFIASKLGCGDNTTEIGQAGPCAFNLDVVLQVLYRLDAPLTDAEAGKWLQTWKRKGLLVASDKRGWYVCCALMQMPTDTLFAELDRARAARNSPNRAG